MAMHSQFITPSAEQLAMSINVQRALKVLRAFTLIEMLLVVSIIALLIAILLPSIRQAKVTATETICASNMRQSVSAFTSYAYDNGKLYPDFSYQPATNSQWTQPHYWSQTYWRDHMAAKYGMQREFFYSPSNPVWNRNDFYWYDTANPATAHAMVTGYFYFGSTIVSTSSFRSSLKVVPPASFKITFARREGAESWSNLLWADLNRQLPEHIGVWLTPSDAKRWGSNHWYGAPNQSVAGSHRAFVDQHVEWVKSPEFKLRSTYGGSHFYW